ncbi:MAG: iron-sulfur cluster assembly accessory protein [Planctomycetes bacterium]|nr:iron-sulfur cluster assembly accessory protein [Planctomycetota bacterium]
MAITLTEHAAEQVKAVATKNGVAGAPCLRVAVKGGGCSGFSYQLDLCNGPVAGDEVFRSHDVEVVCDPKSYLYLNGTEVDYSDRMLGGGFVFNNPNAKASCGCGASFQA